ncbi:MAG: molybdopterin-dependent oxidoreductase [Dehalococcoidales bacterium]|nr:molybdopterin-dependent oxidoreductase [Dehalococcoidales bacterium]
MWKLSKPLVILLVGIVCIAAAIVVYLEPWANTIDAIEWEVTLTGSDGQQQVLSYRDIREMESYEGYGGSISSVGTVSGPFKVKGVTLTSLCDLVGGIAPDDILFVSAKDGYSMVYSYEQVVEGAFDTLVPSTLKNTPHGELRLILMYEQDGKILAEFDGLPLRMATAGPEEYLTEGHFWVKWVNSIEVKTLE